MQSVWRSAIEPFRRNARRVHLIKERAFINGDWVGATSDKFFEVGNPATGEVITAIPDLDECDTSKAIEAAHRAFRKWRNCSPYERSHHLKALHHLMCTNRETLAHIVTSECGKPFVEAQEEVDLATQYTEWFSEECRRASGEIIWSSDPTKKLIVEKYPIGVVGLITSSYLPLISIVKKAAAALSVGCCCIIKPSTDTPLCALAFAGLVYEAKFPKGVLNVLSSSYRNSSACVNALCENSLVRGISFTGSTTIGKHINAKCAPHLKRVVMELSGNNPFIVYDSADLDVAVKSAIVSKFAHCGQCCLAPNRFLVQDRVYDCFLENLIMEVRLLKVGNGSDPDVQVGPMINTKSANRIKALVEDAINKGATVMLGGQRASCLGDLFYEPTILTDVRETMRVYDEEICGPICCIIRFKTEEESLYIANATNFGLSGYIFSSDVSQIFRVGRALHVGMLGINTGKILSCEAPFGGVKDSGFGREGSHHGVDDFIEFKYMCMGNLNYIVP